MNKSEDLLKKSLLKIQWRWASWRLPKLIIITKFYETFMKYEMVKESFSISLSIQNNTWTIDRNKRNRIPPNEESAKWVRQSFFTIFKISLSIFKISFENIGKIVDGSPLVLKAVPIVEVSEWEQTGIDGLCQGHKVDDRTETEDNWKQDEKTHWKIIVGKRKANNLYSNPI